MRLEIDDRRADRRRTVPRKSWPRRAPGRASSGTRRIPASPSRAGALEQAVRLGLDPTGDVGVGRPAVRRVVLEAAVVRWVVARRHDDAVGEATTGRRRGIRGGHRAAAIGHDDRVRDGRRRGEPVAAVDPDVDAARDEDLERGPRRGLAQGVGVAADEQGAVVAAQLAVAADRLGRREDVGFVERATERRAAMAGGPERDPLGRVRRIGLDLVVRPEQGGDVDQVGGVGRLTGAGIVRHGAEGTAISRRPRAFTCADAPARIGSPCPTRSVSNVRLPSLTIVRLGRRRVLGVLRVRAGQRAARVPSASPATRTPPASSSTATWPSRVARRADDPQAEHRRRRR